MIIQCTVCGLVAADLALQTTGMPVIVIAYCPQCNIETTYSTELLAHESASTDPILNQQFHDFIKTSYGNPSNP